MGGKTKTDCGPFTGRTVLFEGKVPVTTEVLEIMPADIYLMAVSDDAIGKLSPLLKKVDGLVVHTSGAMPLSEITGPARKGVWYPLQTFSKDRRLSFFGVPLCIETEKPEDSDLLERFSKSISNTVVFLSSDQRKQLHLAAVFANNFTNHMVHIAQDICHKNDIDERLLLPLIRETADKLGSLSAADAQTGPARRNDKKSMHAHLRLMDDQTQKDIYILLSNAISKMYGSEL